MSETDTSLPWRKGRWGNCAWAIFDAYGGRLGQVYEELGAEQILVAVNAHNALVAMLHRVRSTCHLSEDPTLGSDIDRLIAEAEGREYVGPEEDDDE